MDDIRLCQGISEICDSYTGYIIDQWGVLHDGNKPYEGVLEALDGLKKRKKQIVLLSNSGKRTEDNAQRLEKLGFDLNVFDHIVTSGEMAWLGLNDRKTGIFGNLGDDCYLISRANDTSIIDGLDLNVVDRMDDASFILVSGADDPPNGRTMADFEPILRTGVQKGLRLICANPDIQAVALGGIHMGAGAIAKRYEDFGGVVRYVGKPFPPIFKHAQSLFQDVLPSTTVVIGDSLPMDILGGINCGLDTCLAATGVHGKLFKGVETRADCYKALRGLAANFGVKPNYWIPRFHWGKDLPDRKNKRRAK